MRTRRRRKARISTLRERITNENDAESKKDSWRTTERMRVGLTTGLKSRE